MNWIFWENHLVLSELLTAFGETLTMVLCSTMLAVLIGLPLGVFLVLTSPGHLLNWPWVHRILGILVNALRSTPFLILMILMMPLTKLIVGTGLGVSAAIVPLVIGAAPFFARLVEIALQTVDISAIEMAQSLGASTPQIVWYVLLMETRGQLLSGVIVTGITLVGYSAMAGVVGGGGLGDLAIRHGYQQFETDVMVVTTLLLIALVQILQSFADRWVRYLSRKCG